MHRELPFGDGSRAVWGIDFSPRVLIISSSRVVKGIIGEEAVPGLMRSTPSET